MDVAGTKSYLILTRVSLGLDYLCRVITNSLCISGRH